MAIRNPKNAVMKYIGKDCDKLLITVWIISIVIIYTLSVMLPQNILEINQALKNFVNLMSRYVPSINYYEKYSEFSQIAQLIYSFEIVVLPIYAIFFRRWMRWSFDGDKALDRWFMVFIVMPLTFGSLMIAPFFFFPGKPRILNAILFYHSKFNFTIITTGYFIISTILLLGFIDYIKGIYKYINKYR